MQDTNGFGMHYRAPRVARALSILFVINRGAINAPLFIDSTTKRSVRCIPATIVA